MDDYLSEEVVKKRIVAKKRKKRVLTRVVVIFIVFVLTIVDGALIGKAMGKIRYERTKKPVDHIIAVTKDIPIVNVAVKEVGNEGGQKFWSWYGFNSHVAWCACFVSWCEDQVGYLSSQKAPRYAGCGDGVRWFKSKGAWLDAGKKPKAGDVIFFDWERVGSVDHTGIVTSVVGKRVFTVEGNSTDRCRIKRYYIDDPVILGYGQIE